MRNLPTIEELISFLKDNLKIIILSIVSCLFLFVVGIGYTIYTDSKIEDTVQNTVQEENLLDNIDETLPLEEQLEPEEIGMIVDKLQEDGVEFSFYLEKESADPFKSPDLLKELLVSPNVLNTVEQEANTKIIPSPELAVNVSLNSDNLLLTVTVGTGDVYKNKAIADAYFKIISEENTPFFDNKTVFIVDEPETTEMLDNEDNINETEINSSLTMGSLTPKRIILLAIAAIVLGITIGVIIALALSLLKKEVDEIYGFAVDDEDTILNMSKLNKQSKEEISKQVVHSIIHPSKKTKLVLSETKLDNEIVKKLHDEANIHFENSEDLSNDKEVSVIIANSIIDIDPKINIDEVAFICKKNETTKRWYENQRKLLEVYDTETKVILL